MLQGKPMLCWLYDEPGYECFSTSNRQTVQYRLQLLEEVTFKDIPQSWPPEDRYQHTRTLLWDIPLGQYRFPKSYLAEEEEGFCGAYDTPKAIRQRFWSDEAFTRSEDTTCHAAWEPSLVAANVDWSVLLRTTESSCRKATRDEKRQFEASSAASDADRFDAYLTFTKLPSSEQEKGGFYVFLDPTRCRFTGRLRGTASPQHNEVAVAADPTQLTSSTDLGDT